MSHENAPQQALELGEVICSVTALKGPEDALDGLLVALTGRSGKALEIVLKPRDRRTATIDVTSSEAPPYELSAEPAEVLALVRELLVSRQLVAAVNELCVLARLDVLKRGEKDPLEGK